MVCGNSRFFCGALRKCAFFAWSFVEVYSFYKAFWLKSCFSATLWRNSSFFFPRSFSEIAFSAVIIRNSRLLRDQLTKFAFSPWLIDGSRHFPRSFDKIHILFVVLRKFGVFFCDPLTKSEIFFCERLTKLISSGDVFVKYRVFFFKVQNFKLITVFFIYYISVKF